MLSKHCVKCGIEKSVSEFHKQKRGRFGVRADCKECCNAANNERLHNLQLLKRHDNRSKNNRSWPDMP